MLKKIFTFLILLTTSACSNYDYTNKKTCPNAKIPRETAYLVQTNRTTEELSIELIGYEGYCYYDEKMKEDKSVITPIFKIKRINLTSQTDVSFSYHLTTIRGPKEYIFTQTRRVNVLIPKDVNEVTHHGKQVELKIPSGMKYEYDVVLSLALSNSEYKYNQRTFDVNL